MQRIEFVDDGEHLRMKECEVLPGETFWDSEGEDAQQFALQFASSQGQIVTVVAGSDDAPVVMRLEPSRREITFLIVQSAKILISWRRGPYLTHGEFFVEEGSRPLRERVRHRLCAPHSN